MRQTTGNLLQGQIFHQEQPFQQASQQQANSFQPVIQQQAKHKANSKKNELTDSFISFDQRRKKEKIRKCLKFGTFTMSYVFTFILGYFVKTRMDDCSGSL